MPLGARRTFRFGAVMALSLVLAYGLAEGGRDGARKALNNFWR